MKNLYNSLRDILIDNGFNVAPYGEHTFTNEDRDIRITLISKTPLAPCFDMYSASLEISFINGENWAENASKLSDALMSFIPMQDRPDEQSKTLPDNSDKLTLLDVPEFGEIQAVFDQDNGDQEYQVGVTLHYSNN